MWRRSKDMAWLWWTRLQLWRAKWRLWGNEPGMAKKLEQELGIGALRQKWRAHIVLIDEPIKPHDNMKCIMLFFVKFKPSVYLCWWSSGFDGELWRNLMLCAMIKCRVVGYIYGVIIVYHLMKLVVGCLCNITNMEMNWNAQGKGIIIEYFISPV